MYSSTTVQISHCDEAHRIQMICCLAALKVDADVPSYRAGRDSYETSSTSTFISSDARHKHARLCHAIKTAIRRYAKCWPPQTAVIRRSTSRASPFRSSRPTASHTLPTCFRSRPVRGARRASPIPRSRPSLCARRRLTYHIRWRRS